MYEINEIYARFTYFIQGINFMFLVGSVYILLKFFPKDRLKTILAGIFLYHIFVYLKYLPIYYTSLIHTDYLRQLSQCFDTWLIAAYTFYLLEIIKPGWVNLKRILLTLLPFVVLTVLFALCKKIEIYKLMTFYAIAYSLVVYLYFALYHKRYNAKIHAYYSYSKPFNTRWIHLLVANALVVYLVIWILVKDDYSKDLVSIIYYVLTFCIYNFMLFNGLRQENVVSEHDFTMHNKEISTSVSEINYVQQIEWHLEKEMQNKKLYLNPRLTINDVAQTLGTNRTYLSNYLNHTLQISFFDYINAMRIDYADELLASADNNDTLELISEKSGFNSLSTFRRAFEKKHHCKPSEFRKNHSNH